MDFTKLKKNIGRIFSNPNTITFILAIISIIVLYNVYAYMVNNAIQPTTLFYANADLYEGDVITNDKVSPVEISGSFLSSQGGNLLRGVGEIYNKYVADGYRIPQNSFFYRTAVTSLDAADSTPFTDLKDNYTIYRLPVDFHSTYGSSIMDGDYIDVYAKLEMPDGKLFNDIFIKSIQVYMVVDSSGYNVFTHTKEGERLNPSILYFAVPIETYKLLEIAKLGKEYKIDFYPVPRDTSYSENPEEPSIVNEGLKDLIYSQATAEN
jgi:hypothetical protein